MNLLSRIGFAFDHQEFLFGFDQSQEAQLYDGLGMFNGLGATEDPVEFSFGAPFISMRSLIEDEIERYSPMPSPVITRVSND